MYTMRPTPFVGLVSRPKLNAPGRHVGAYLPDGRVAHMTRQGAMIVSIEEFAQGHPVKAEKAASPAIYRQMQWRAYQSAGRMPPYDVVSRNCEHYATWLLGEQPQSAQVTSLFVLGLIGTLIWLTR